MSLIKALLLADNDKSKVDFIEAQIWTVNSFKTGTEDELRNVAELLLVRS